MAIKRMDNVGIVDDLEGTIDFFQELGLEFEGRVTIEGEWAGRVTGLGDQHVEIAMMRTPDGRDRRFHLPSGSSASQKRCMRTQSRQTTEVAAVPCLMSAIIGSQRCHKDCGRSLPIAACCH